MCYSYLTGSLFLNALEAGTLSGNGLDFHLSACGQESPLSYSLLSLQE